MVAAIQVPPDGENGTGPAGDRLLDPS